MEQKQIGKIVYQEEIIYSGFFLLVTSLFQVVIIRCHRVPRAICRIQAFAYQAKIKKGLTKDMSVEKLLA